MKVGQGVDPIGRLSLPNRQDGHHFVRQPRILEDRSEGIHGRIIRPVNVFDRQEEAALSPDPKDREEEVFERLPKGPPREILERGGETHQIG